MTTRRFPGRSVTNSCRTPRNLSCTGLGLVPTLPHKDSFDSFSLLKASVLDTVVCVWTCWLKCSKVATSD